MRRYFIYIKNTTVIANWKAAYHKSVKRLNLCELPASAIQDDMHHLPSARSNSIVDGLAALLFMVSFAMIVCCFGI